MRKRTVKIITTGIILGLIISTAAFGNGKYMQGCETHGKMIDKMFNGLDLTIGQREELKDYFRKAEKGRKEIKARIRSVRKSLHKELGKPGPAPAKLDVLVDMLKEASVDSVDHRVNSMMRLREILTPEQYKRFMEKREHRRSGKKFRRFLEDQSVQE